MLTELEEKEDIKLLLALLRKYGMKPAMPGGGLAKGNRYFVLVNGRYWVAGAWVHYPTPFRFVGEALRLPVANAYFLRRVAQFAPGHWIVELLHALGRRLVDEEGKDALWALGLPDHSNAIYREAGWRLAGETRRSRHPVYVYDRTCNPK